MKQVIFILLFFLSITGIKAQCPPDTRGVLTFTCSYDFHRQKFDCKTGFWLCNVNCIWKYDCIPKNNVSFGFVFCRIYNDKYVEFHFPIDVLKKQQFTEKELSVFNVDDPLIFDFKEQKVQLVVGDYPTKLSAQEVVILVPYHKL